MRSDAPNGQDGVRAAGRGTAWVILGGVCALVIGFYGGSARVGEYEMRISRAADSYYNLLVRGLCAGQLNLKTEAPPGLAKLADPYDPLGRGVDLEADGHPVMDLSYYHGKLYLHHGITPALVLFWPYAALTGQYLWHKDAVVVFCATGFLAGVGLLCAVWRRWFPGIGVGVVAAGALGLGLAGFTPMILARAEVFEVAISCGYALTMLALLALWEACERPERRGRWLAAASLAYGLAIGARPTALFGAVILLLPVAQAWREGRRVAAALLAAAAPITCIGLGIMLYNTLRFENPFEFGVQYQLLPFRLAAIVQWSAHYLGFNFWVYFLAPARWGARFPFVHDINLPSLPAGYVAAEHLFGILANMPVVWLAVAAPLAWRGRSGDARWLVGGLVAAAAWIFATRALPLGLWHISCVRYEMDFSPALILLAVVGIFGLERALAGWPGWRRAARWVWGLLLAFSVAFSLLASAIHQAQYHWELGNLLRDRGHGDEAVAHYLKAAALQPDEPVGHFIRGIVFRQKGRLDEAVEQFREALRLRPDYADARRHLEAALAAQAHAFQPASGVTNP